MVVILVWEIMLVGHGDHLVYFAIATENGHIQQQHHLLEPM
jgi:hypothetical protein